MEDPTDRDNKIRMLMRNHHKKTEMVKSQWAEPTRPKSFWRYKDQFRQHEFDVASGGSDGKQTKLMFNSTSSANSLDSILSMYHEIEQRQPLGAGN
mmetsp:Transcript_8637/g.12153  ORF Transcript_8637/g.12153 Transcript_8637/m.12153 type:complete len:96 (+) Transcript_8637:3-290(+)